MEEVRVTTSKFYDARTNTYTEVCPYQTDGATIGMQISSILKNRREHCGALEEAENALRDISGAVDGFLRSKEDMFPDKASVDKLFDGGQPGEGDAFWTNLANMDVTLAKTIGGKCKSIADLIRNTKARFNRKSICVAVVGNNGEGKSTLIQNITGLDEHTIPTSSGGICTAARSMIKNEDEFSANIYFYTLQELLDDVLAPYFRHFGVLRADENLRTMFDAQRLFREIPIGAGDQYYDRLKLYMTEQDKYKHMLGRANQIVTRPEEVRKYISRCDKDGRDLNSYAYLAVKFVEVECPFPSIDVKNLILIDTIGVNEPTLNIKQQMFETIKDSADFVLYVKKSVSDRTTWVEDSCMQLYFDILKRLPNIPANKWVYCVFNYKREFGENGMQLESFFPKNYERMLSLIPEQEAAKRPGAIIDVNCCDREEVANNLIAPMLKHLAANLKDIDAALIEAVNERMIELSADFKAFSASIDTLMLKERSDTVLREVLTDEFILNMTSKFKESALKYRETLCKDNTTDDWRVSVREIAERIEDFIPTEEDVQSLYQKNGSALLTIENIYSVTRDRLQSMFDNGKFQFDALAQDAKRECARMFMQAGGFDNIPMFRVDPDRPHALFEIAKMFFKDQTTSVLEREFCAIDSLSIDHGRTLSQYMTQIITCIDTNRGDGNIPAYWADTGLARAIIEKLKSKMPLIREEISKNISTMVSPEQMVSNVINAFVTTITQISQPAINLAWRVTVKPFINQLQPESFNDMETFNGNVSYWNSIVEGLKRMTTLGKINFAD